MTYHFIGLGGIGMSGLARILIQKGKVVQGSDIKSSHLLDSLTQEGAKVWIGHHEMYIQKEMTVVYSTDIQNANPEYQKAKQLGLTLFHRSDLLNVLMENQKPLLVTGAHGKTTTTALLAWVLLQASWDPSFIIGGILSAHGTNGSYGKGSFFVAEADESDGSFLKTVPFGAIVTNFDREHLSFWKTEEHLAAAFQTFLDGTLHDQHLFWCYDDEKLKTLAKKGVSYGFSVGSDLRIMEYKEGDRNIFFDLQWNGRKYKDIEFSMIGRHQALNASAVFGLLLSLGVPEDKIREGLKTFSGVKRRLDWKGKKHTLDVFDDYGHHPNEIKVTLKALRSIAKERRIVAIFQPHRYTRVCELWNDFADALTDADLVIMTDIYSAGEPPIPGISSKAFQEMLEMTLKNKLIFVPREGLESQACDHLQLFDVVITLGAGNITEVGSSLLKNWDQKRQKMKIALLFGGSSVEHDVSIMSAKTIFHALNRDYYDVYLFGIDRDGRWSFGEHTLDDLSDGSDFLQIVKQLKLVDAAIPVMHGTNGEDGMIQGFLETLDIPYVGCDFRSSALCMHKGWTKHVALMHGIPTAPFIQIEKRAQEESISRIESVLSYPVWVKPVHLGSSIGVTQVQNREELEEALVKAFELDDCVIVEAHIDGRQIEFGVIGNDWIRVGVPSEVMAQGQFLDYDGKYGAKAAEIVVPAPISPMETELGLDLAKKVYEILGCKGLARVDFFLDNQGHYWLNEVNPFPGCTSTSAFPKIWQASHTSMQDLCDLLIIFALQRTRV